MSRQHKRPPKGLARRRMNGVEFYRRVSDLLDVSRLQSKRVAVVGLGSGGCRVAAELGRLGVQLMLVERPAERLQEHNIVRHLLGYRSLGKTKLGQMAKYIRNLNPSAQVRCCALDVVERQESLERLLQRWRPDAIAVCTDNEPSKHAVNEVALRLAVPQTGGAVYDGGIGGEVYRIGRGQACYGCLAAHLQLDRQFARTSTLQDYSSPVNHEAPTTCALSLDIQQIALLQSRLTLELLLEPGPGLVGLPPEVNLCVFANRLVPGTFARPWHCEFFSIPRRNDCLCCGRTSDGFEREADNVLLAFRCSRQEVCR